MLNDYQQLAGRTDDREALAQARALLDSEIPYRSGTTSLADTKRTLERAGYGYVVAHNQRHSADHPTDFEYHLLWLHNLR